MLIVPANYRRRLSTKLFIANILISLSFLLIAGFIVYSFISVRTQSVNIATTYLDNIIRNSKVTLELSEVFSDIDLLDITLYGNTNDLRAEGARLATKIENIQKSTNNQILRDSLSDLSDRFNRFLSHSVVANEVLRARDVIDEEIHTELTKLEAIIADWLIDSTLKGENTDYVTQQLTLVNGYRESLLIIAKMYAELNLNTISRSLSPQETIVLEAIDDLALRLRTITASIQEVASREVIIEDMVRKYREVVEQVFKEAALLNSLRVDLIASKNRSLSAMGKIETNLSKTAQLAVDKIDDVVTFAGNAVVLSTLVVIALIFFTTTQLIKHNIRKPMQAILDGIRSFGKGDFQGKIELGRQDEWDTIGQSLNSMAADLDQSREELQNSYEELENRVEERTQELAQTVKALSRSEASLVEAQRIAHLGHWSWDIRTGKNEWSEEQYRIFGFQPYEVDVNQELFASFLHPEDADPVLAALSEAVKQNKNYSAEFRIVRCDGTIRWIEAQGRVTSGDDGEPIEMSGTMLDITERKRIEQLLLEEKERALVTLHSIGDAVIATDADGYIEYLNPVAEKLTGFKLDEARGQALARVFRIMNEETGKAAEDPVARCLLEGKVVGLANHTVLVSKSGMEYAIQDSAAPIKSPTGEVLGVVLVFSDVTEERLLSKQISYQASHDGLTGLINRQEFERRLKRVVATAHTGLTDNALCYLDLDQFKLINDTCGHVAGDRHRDTVARLGGDHVDILMEHCSLEKAKQVAIKLVEAVSDYEFYWKDKRFKIGASIGLVAVNESSTDVNGLLSAADNACYMAKEQGRNRIHVFQDDDEHLLQRHGEMQWAVRLPRALEEGRLRLYFQPMMPVAAEVVEGAHYEILVRLEEDQLVLPETFLPAADRYQLSSRLDRWVIETTFQWIADHPAHLRSLHICAINLSGHSLNEETFLQFVNQKLKDSPIPPEKICFEITETVAIANLSRATDFMKNLKNQGCQFALDDFGSGLSSFAYLKKLPVDFLKIDGVFVKDILDDSLDLALVKSINEIGKVMGIKTIAEYVEDKAILEKLREIGVNYAQGFVVDRPRPIEELLH